MPALMLPRYAADASHAAAAGHAAISGFILPLIDFRRLIIASSHADFRCRHDALAIFSLLFADHFRHAMRHA